MTLNLTVRIPKGLMGLSYAYVAKPRLTGNTAGLPSGCHSSRFLYLCHPTLCKCTGREALARLVLLLALWTSTMFELTSLPKVENLDKNK